MVELQSMGYQPVFYPLKRVKDVLIRPTVLNIDSLSQFVLRNQSAQGRKSL